MTSTSHVITGRMKEKLSTLFLGLMVCSSGAWALTAANTIIKNQASATFKDETGQKYSVTSNMVETLVQQVAGVDLVQDQSKRANPGGTVYFPHVLTNVGNGNDQYPLTTGDVATVDNYDFGGGNITLYADLDQDGQPDNLSSPITSTPVLAAGESFSFVVVAEVPASVAADDEGQLTITATSNFNNATTDSNTDTVDVTDQAIIDVTKAISATSGPAGSGSYTVTLTYRNDSVNTATDVTLVDALPTGMDYVAGSGLWSETGTSALTDNDPADTHAGASSTISYCAYDATCTGVSEAQQDADSDTTNQVTAIINEVAPGATGELSFEVNIASDLPADKLVNIAEYEYHDGTSTITLAPTNRVIFQVTPTPGVVTNGSSTDSTDLTDEPITVASVSQGGTVAFTDYVWNTGNGTDSFDLDLSGSNFPAGTAFLLYKADGFTPIVDTNGNGIPDTGNLDADESGTVIIKAILPPSATGSNYEVTLNATSFEDDSLTNPARNILTTITSSSADLTNDAALGSGTELGAGAGPEASALTTNTTQPGTTTSFTLYLNNTSDSTDTYNLAAGTDSTFVAQETLPSGWSVIFRDSSNNTLTNSGVIGAGESKLVYADVTIPAGETAGTTSIYFKINSPTTGAADIKHDAVTVGEVTDVVLEPNNQGQVLPGGTIIYSHWLTNQGNVDKSDIALSKTDSASVDGWSSVLYEDTNGDGELGAGDLTITNVANLTSGESKLLFVKVFAPASVPMGTNNLTTITATWDGGAESTFAEDLTTTNRSDVKITKEQALDELCDGTEDFAFSVNNFDVEPGQCVMYRLTAINTGAETMHNVRIQDATPSFTSFYTAGGTLPSLTQGSLVTTVTDGSEGDVIGNMGSLPAGSNAALIFGIEIE